MKQYSKDGLSEGLSYELIGEYVDMDKYVEQMKKNICDGGTLASKLNFEKEEKDPNIVKVITGKEIKKKDFSDALSSSWSKEIRSTSSSGFAFKRSASFLTTISLSFK